MEGIQVIPVPNTIHYRLSISAFVIITIRLFTYAGIQISEGSVLGFVSFHLQLCDIFHRLPWNSAWSGCSSGRGIQNCSLFFLNMVILATLCWEIINENFQGLWAVSWPNHSFTFGGLGKGCGSYGVNLGAAVLPPKNYRHLTAKMRNYTSDSKIFSRCKNCTNRTFSVTKLDTHRVKWRHRIYDHDTIAILWV